MARKAGAEVYRGSEGDVLNRYYRAAQEARADVIMRITGDCPLISPALCREVLMARERNNAHYASNIDPRTFPQGFDCEVFTYALLSQANKNAHPHEREHVTTWMRRQKNIRRVNVASPWLLDGRLTLDTKDDYKVILASFASQSDQHSRAA